MVAKFSPDFFARLGFAGNFIRPFMGYVAIGAEARTPERLL